MPVRSIILVLGLLLAACDTPFGEQATRAAAKQVVNEVVAEQAPGVNAAPITDCIIDNASGSEIRALAGDAVTGVTPQTVSLVLQIAARPGSVSCLVEAAGPLVIGELIAPGG